MPITAQLFDGTVLEFPDGTDPAVIDKVARQETLSRQPQEEASLGKRFTSSFERAGTSIGTGVRGAMGTPEEAAAAAKAGAAEQERISREVGPTRGFAEVKDIYQREGLLPAAGEFVSQIPGAVAEQGANILGTLGAGFAGAKVGALAGPIGATVGGIAGAAGYLYPQFFGANLEEQARVAQEQKKQLELDRSSAAVAAAGQTALEAGGTAFTLGRNLIGKMIGKEVSKELAEKQLLQTAQASLAGGAGRGAARGLSEIPVEVAQTVLERWQSGQDLLSDDAIEKYGLAAYGALQAGPAIGAVASPLDRRAARQELEARGLTPTGEAIEPPMTPEREAILRREQETADVMRERELQALELKKQEEEAAQLKNAGELSAKVGEIGQEIAGVSLEAEGLDDSLNSLYAAKDNLTILKQNLDRASANKEVRQQINEQLKLVNDKIGEGQAFAKTIGLEPTRRAKLAKEEVGYIPEERRAKASAAVFEGAAPEQVVMRELGPPQIATAPEVVDLTIKPQELLDIGLPKSAAYTKQLSGLDLADADQRTKAADIIGRAMQNPQVKPEVKEKLQNLYDSKLAAPVPAAQGALDFEAELPPAAPVAPTKVDDSVLDTLGIGKTAVLRKNADLRNADLTKPEDRQFVRNVLETYRDAPNRSDSIKEKIDAFLEQLPVDEAPVTEAPVVEAPAVETPAVETPVVEAPTAPETAAAPTPPQTSTAMGMLGEGSTETTPTPPTAAPVIEGRRGFGTALGATGIATDTLTGRDNPPLAKAIFAGDTAKALDLLSRSKNKIIAYIAEKSKALKGLNIIADESAAEMRTVREQYEQGVNVARVNLALLDMARQAKAEVDAHTGEGLPPLGKYRSDVIQINQNTGEMETRSVGLSSSVGTTKESFYQILNNLEAGIGQREDQVRAYVAMASKRIAVPAMYDPATNTVRVDVSQWTEGTLTPVRETTVAHELAHALTLNSLERPTVAQRPVVNKMQALFEHVRNQPQVADMYGVTTLEEFVAEGFSNPEFQLRLSKIPYENTSTLSKFAQFVANLLGLKADNAFTEFLSLVDGLTPRKGAKDVKPAPTPTEPAAVGQPSERGVGVADVGGIPATTQESAPGATTAPESGGLVRPAERAGIDTQGIEQAPAPVTTPTSLPSETTSHDEALQRVAELQMGEEVDPKALAKLTRDAADSGLITQTDRRQIATEIAEGDVVGAASSLEGMLQKSKDQSIPNAVQTLQATGDSAGAVTDNLTKAFTAQDPIAALQVIVNDNSGVFNPKEQLVARKILDMRMPMPTMRMVDSLGNDVNGDPILGEYNSLTDQIALVQGAADSHTFLHEMIHAFVHRSIVLQERGQARNPNFRTLQEVYDHVKANRPDLAKEYGLSSLTEFASEAMSNRDFQFQLMGMPYRNQSVFSWFARALRSLLGIAEGSPQGNVLFTAMVAVDGLMRSGRELQMRTTGKSIFASDIAYVAQNVNTPLGKPLPTSLAEVNQAPNQVQRTEMRKFLNTVSQGEAGYATLMRQQVVDILAPIAKRLSDAFSQGVRGQFGDVNPIVWMRQAFDHQRIALQVYRTGGLKLESNGLWTATELKDSQGKPASPQMIVEKLAELAKKNNSTYQTTKAKVATVLEGMRLKELRDHNRKLETLALEQAAAGDVDAAYETRLGKVLLHRTNAEIDALVNVFNKSPEIQEIQRIMNTVRGNLIDAMVTSGRIRKEQADNWKAAVNYVPFDRLKDISENPEIVFAAGRKGIAALGKLPQLKGSLGRPVANAIDNYMHKLAWMTEQSMRNSAVVRTLNIMADAGMATKLDSPKNATNTHLVLPALYEGGNPVFFEVQNQYDLAAFAEAPEIKGSLINVFSASSRLLRTTVTATPMFALKQVFDDAQRVMFYSGVKNPLAAMGKTLINLPRILFLKNFGGNKAVIDSLERSGIVGDYDFNPINPIETVEFDTNAVRRSPVRALVHAMEQVTKASDMAARLAVYEQTMRETGDAVLAQSRARELINFNRRGASKTMRMLTHIIPFFNSWAQGTDLLYRGFTGEDASSGMAKKAAAGMFISRILTMMAMGTMYALVMSDDEGYEETSDEVRDRAWILPKSVSDAFGMKQSLKIPVPIELGFIFKSIPERAIQYYKDHTKDEAKPAVDAALDFLRGAVTVYGNEPIPAILRPALENYTNFSFFTKRELISPSLKAKPAALQYTPATSEFAKWLGEQTSTSPIQIDNFVRGYFGLMGSTASMMLDSMMNPARPDRGLEQLPFLSIGIMAPVGSRTKDDFYEFREKVAAAVAGKNSLKDDPEKQAKFIEKNYHLLAAAPYVNAKLKMLRTIREQKKIYESGADIGMSGAERRDAINELKRIETEILSDIGRVRTDYMRLKE